MTQNMYFGYGAISSIGAVGHATIRQGSTGPDVIEWQKIIGVAADGQFGPQTLAATKAWQSSHGLVADGIVGPLTWGKATGLVAKLTSTPMLVAGGLAATAGAGWWWWKKRRGR